MGTTRFRVCCTLESPRSAAASSGASRSPSSAVKLFSSQCRRTRPDNHEAVCTDTLRDRPTRRKVTARHDPRDVHMYIASSRGGATPQDAEHVMKHNCCLGTPGDACELREQVPTSIGKTRMFDRGGQQRELSSGCNSKGQKHCPTQCGS